VSFPVSVVARSDSRAYGPQSMCSLLFLELVMRPAGCVIGRLTLLEAASLHAAILQHVK